jgi:hypothetical protein
VPTTTELLDLDGVAARTSTFRLDVVDASLTLIGTLGAGADQPASVENNINRTVKRTMSGVRIPPSELAAVRPYSDRVRPVMVLENGVELPVGVFLFGDLSRTIDTAGTEAEASLVDQTVILDTGIAEPYSVPAGKSLTVAMGEILAASPVAAYDVAQTGQVAGSPLAWPAGASRLRVLSDLAATAGFYSPYFDNAGTCRLVAVPDLSAASASIVYAQGGVDTGRVIRGSIVRSDDTLGAPNRYVAVDASGQGGGFVGAYDVPATAPHSAANRGFVISRTVEVQGLATQADATAAAKAAGLQDTSYEHLQFASPPDPRHDTFDVVEFDGAVWREQSWTMTLREGEPMKHVLRRVYQG